MKPLVLVHGFMGGSAQWNTLVPALQDDFNIIAIDLPGFGANNHLTAPDEMSGFAEYVLNTVSSRGVDTFDLLGHSMGGMIVQEMIAIAPDRVEKLILYGTGASGVLPNRFETIDVSKQRAKTDGARATARRIAATWFLEREDAPPYEDCATIAEQSTPQSIDAGLDAMRHWSRVDALSQITAPTMVVWGDQDRTYGWPQTEQLWKTIPSANLAVVPSCAHAVHLEKPDIFNNIVADFLTKRPLGSI